MNYEVMTDRELDALVAEKVMGWIRGDKYSEKVRSTKFTKVVWVDPETETCTGDFLPSINIGSAFEVVEAMRARVEGFVFDATTGVLGLWEASFLQVLSSKELEGAMDEKLISSEVGGSLPRAICIAALRACE